MDDVDAFLASLDRFSSPSIDAGIQRQRVQQQAPQSTAPATAASSGSSATAAPRASRRRPRDEDAEVPQQQLRALNDAPARGRPALDVDSAYDETSRDGPIPTWYCVRCNTENSDFMHSCAICHRRRERAEGPRPTDPVNSTTVHTASLNTSSSSPSFTSPADLPSAASTEIVSRGGGYAIRPPGSADPVVVAGPGEVSCPRCTFLNPSSRRTCEMCEGALPTSTAASAVPAARAANFQHVPSASVVGLPQGQSVGAVTPSAAASAAVPSVSLSGLNGRSASPIFRRSVSPSPTGPMLMNTETNGTVLPRPVVLQDAVRETLSLSPVALARDAINEEGATSSSSSSESDDDDDATDVDSDWNDLQNSSTGIVDHRELVRFLETLQSVQFDNLPRAAVPASMRARAELRPFQLQALYWLLTREHQRPRVDDGDLLLDSTNQNDRKGMATESSASWHDGGDEDHYSGDKSGSNSSSPTSPYATKNAGDSVRGGVFADFMGLGKTRTLIALCESARAPRMDRVTGSLVESTATLIVCPTALLAQWVEEIRRCVERPASSPLRILVYYGARKRSQTLFQVAQSYDYVLTTYQTLTHEQAPLSFAPAPGWARGEATTHNNAGSDGESMSDAFFGRDPYDAVDALAAEDGEAYDVDRHLQTEVGKLFLIRWARIILDEAHYIRNMRTRQSRACLKLSGVCKWAVTATPVQNSLNDLYPLLRFLAVPHFSALNWWNDEIVRYFNHNPQHPRVVTALSILFRSILLRRTPDSVVDGKPILDLPPKRMITHTVALSRDETRFYKGIHTKATEKLSELRSRDVVGTRGPLATFTTAFEMLVRCRQTCLHPYIVVAALRRCRRLADTTKTNSGNEPGASESSGHNTSPDAVKDDDLRRRREKEEEEERTARALDHFIQTVVLRRLRTIKASEFVQSLVAEIKAQKLESRECIICLDTVNKPAILPCAHVFCEECVKHALEATRRCPLCKRNTKSSEMLLVPVDLLNSGQHPSASIMAAAPDGPDGKEKSGAAEVEPPPEVPFDLDLSVVANWELRLSSKTQYLIDTIRGLPADDKVVVFSNFLTYLHFAQHYLESAGVACAIYSGSMTMKQRQVLLERFADASRADSPRVLLATMSSCGVGLNLTCANHCFLMEPSWNPGTEEQALNRIHRIGQQKPVTVTKLIADGTIEQNISQLCERKRALSGYCFGDGGAGGGGDGRLRTADLLALFAPEEEDEESSDESSEEDEH